MAIVRLGRRFYAHENDDHRSGHASRLLLINDKEITQNKN